MMVFSAAMLAVVSVVQGGRANKPNIWLTVGDDMGWANAGWHNPDNVHTPVMNKMIKEEGIELDRHYVFFYCSPTRSSLMTGRLPAHVSEDNGNACTDVGAAPRPMATIANKLASVGYKTHQIGKWHLGQNHNGSTPTGRGFSTSIGYLGGAEDHYLDTNAGCGHCGAKVDLWRDYEPAHGENGTLFSAYRYNREALAIIDNHDPAGPPLFTYLALQCAHAPNQADAYANLYPASASYTTAYANYNGMISAIDDVVKNVTDALKTKGLWENTLFVFTSDNGGPAAASVSGSSASNWPLRGGKHTAWEGGHRVLAWISGGLVPPAMRGMKLEGLIHGCDWYATFCGLAGVNATDDAPGMPGIDSIDQWAYITGSVVDSPRTEILLASAFAAKPSNDASAANGSAALLVGKYKLVRYAQQYCFWMGPRYPNASTDHKNEDSCDCGSKGCLYDVFADPGEHTDLSESQPQIAAQLRARAEELDRTQIDFVLGGPNLTAWRGQGDPARACELAESQYGGFWGPIWFP
eukprot:m.125968 g.125968  ORF g.125968 m.125968 type:complete len:523 (+) comp22161_c0_seq1:3-1571(+)